MSTERIRLEIPATFSYLELLSTCIAKLIERVEHVPEPEQTSYSIQLAAQEISANIVRHAYCGHAGRITADLIIESSPNRIVIDLCDSGASFDPDQVQPLDLDQVNVHGYGLFLARTLLDELGYEARPGENRWRLVKHLAARHTEEPPPR
jgi:serine/threonine-protein kinase RsbW